MSKEWNRHGIPFGRQLAQIISAVTIAIADVASEINYSRLLTGVNNKKERLVSCLRIAFLALTTDREVVLGRKYEQPNSDLTYKRQDIVMVSGGRTFVGNEHFVVNYYDEKSPSKVKIYYLSDTFIEHFGRCVEKFVKEAVIESMSMHRITKTFNSGTRDIEESTVSAKKVKADLQPVTLAHLWELLSDQPNCEKGILENHGLNVFLIPDFNGTNRLVEVRSADGVAWTIRMGREEGNYRQRLQEDVSIPRFFTSVM
jgi:hypothetical protein